MKMDDLVVPPLMEPPHIGLQCNGENDDPAVDVGNPVVPKLSRYTRISQFQSTIPLS